MEHIILIDPSKCLGCKSCELLCAVEHSKSKELLKAIDEHPLPKTRVKVEFFPDLTLPLQCRHCEDAPCIKICPTKAIERTKENDPVLINEKFCIGCKWCVLVCPFGSITMDTKNKTVTKCDLCLERLKKGELPVCVIACPTGAMQFKSTKKATSKKHKDYLVKYKKGENLV